MPMCLQQPCPFDADLSAHLSQHLVNFSGVLTPVHFFLGQVLELLHLWVIQKVVQDSYEGSARQEVGLLELEGT